MKENNILNKKELSETKAGADLPELPEGKRYCTRGPICPEFNPNTCIRSIKPTPDYSCL